MEHISNAHYYTYFVDGGAYGKELWQNLRVYWHIVILSSKQIRQYYWMLRVYNARKKFTIAGLCASDFEQQNWRHFALCGKMFVWLVNNWCGNSSIIIIEKTFWPRELTIQLVDNATTLYCNPRTFNVEYGTFNCTNVEPLSNCMAFRMTEYHPTRIHIFLKTWYAIYK